MKNKNIENNWFRPVIIVLFIVIVFLLVKIFVFTPEATRSIKTQECLLLMKKIEIVSKEYDALIATPKYENFTKEELNILRNEMIESRDLTLEEIPKCWAFLEAENIDYPIKDKF